MPYLTPQLQGRKNSTAMNSYEAQTKPGLKILKYKLSKIRRNR